MISTPRYSVAVICFVLVGATFLFTGCNREGQLEGEAFIVTRGGENIELGLVEVRAIPEDEITDFVLQKKRIAQDSLAKWDPVVSRSEARVDSIRAVEDSLEAVADSLRDTSRWWDSTEYEALQERLDKTRSEETDIFSAMLWDKNTRARWQNEDFFFEDLPEGVASTKTDAEGEFSLTLKRNDRYAIAAKGSRHIGGRNEDYHWLIWTSLEGEPSKRIFLSNDNLTDVNPEEGVLQTVALGEEP